MSAAVVLIHGYWGQGPDWEAVVHGTIGTGFARCYELAQMGMNVKVVLGTGELERLNPARDSVVLAREVIGSFRSSNPEMLNHPELAAFYEQLLEDAHVLTNTMNTAEEIAVALAECKAMGARDLYSIHRPEHVRAYLMATKLGRAHNIRVFGLASPVDFPGVGDAVCIEGVHMDDPERDAYAIFADVTLRKQAAGKLFGFKETELIFFLRDLNGLLDKRGKPTLDLTLNAKHM